MKLKFTIDRMRDDGYSKTVTCEIERPEEICRKLDGRCAEFDEDTYNRFCREAPQIARAVSGLEIGYDWFFDYGPAIVKEV